MSQVFEDIRSIVYCHSFDMEVDFTEDAIFYHYLIENPPDNHYKIRVYEWNKNRINICTVKGDNFEVSVDKAISINLVLNLIHKLNEKTCEYCAIGSQEDYNDYEKYLISAR